MSKIDLSSISVNLTTETFEYDKADTVWVAISTCLVFIMVRVSLIKTNTSLINQNHFTIYRFLD